MGGAIDSVIGNLKYPETLTVTDSKLTQNDATGGSNNSGTSSVFDLVGSAVGGCIANGLGSTANISDNELENNNASGGNNNTANGTGFHSTGFGAGAPSVITLATTTPVLSAD